MARIEIDLNSRPAKILQPGDSNTKTDKNDSPTWSLSMAQAELGGKNVCPHSTPGCRAVCVGKAGMASVFPNIMKYRIRKNNWFFQDRKGFIAKLERELSAANKFCAKRGVVGRVRLNTFSDIGWFSILTNLAQYTNLHFYDYTKNMAAAEWSLANPSSNYRLCYSFNEESNWSEVKDFIERGGTVAVVFRDVVYNPAHNNIGKLPETWRGVPVVDGDITDDRWKDPKGCIVGLRLKGTKARKKAACDTGFAVYAFGAPVTLTVS